MCSDARPRTCARCMCSSAAALEASASRMPLHPPPTSVLQATARPAVANPLWRRLAAAAREKSECSPDIGVSAGRRFLGKSELLSLVLSWPLSWLESTCCRRGRLGVTYAGGRGERAPEGGAATVKHAATASSSHTGCSMPYAEDCISRVHTVMCASSPCAVEGEAPSNTTPSQARGPSFAPAASNRPRIPRVISESKVHTSSTHHLAACRGGGDGGRAVPSPTVRRRRDCRTRSAAAGAKVLVEHTGKRRLAAAATTAAP